MKFIMAESKDAFGPVIKRKLEHFGSTVLEQIVVPDDKQAIIDAVNHFKEAGCHLIITTGGMSVDPDDLTPTAIKGAGAEIICYGAPVLPGAMLMLAYFGDIPVLGLPGCVMYNSTTVFDLVLPRILAGERLSRRDIIRLGHGGLCSGCLECGFPIAASAREGINMTTQVLIPLEKARQLFFDLMEVMPSERVPLELIGGRVLAEDIYAENNIPPFHRSPLDGFAFRAEDTQGATEESPLLASDPGGSTGWLLA
jgi:molybdopterin biosynthesis enzyme